MTQKDILRDLFLHMEWADAAVWRAVLAHPAATADDRILRLFFHLHVAQHGFHRAWVGIPRDDPYPEFTETRPLMEWAKAWFPEAFAFLDAADPAALPKTLNLPWASFIERRLGRPAADTTLGDTMLQAAMHSHYHLGQVNARLKETGGEPPMVDYIGWVWYGKPKAEWPRTTAAAGG